MEQLLIDRFNFHKVTIKERAIAMKNNKNTLPNQDDAAGNLLNEIRDLMEQALMVDRATVAQGLKALNRNFTANLNWAAPDMFISTLYIQEVSQLLRNLRVRGETESESIIRIFKVLQDRQSDLKAALQHDASHKELYSSTTGFRREQDLWLAAFRTSCIKWLEHPIDVIQRYMVQLKK